MATEPFSRSPASRRHRRPLSEPSAQRRSCSSCASSPVRPAPCRSGQDTKSSSCGGGRRRNELVSPADDSHVPIVVRRDSERHRRESFGRPFCKDVYEANVIPIHGQSFERRAALESEYVRTLAQNHLRIERQTANELRAKRLASARIANDEQTRRSDVGDVKTL